MKTLGSFFKIISSNNAVTASTYCGHSCKLGVKCECAHVSQQAIPAWELEGVTAQDCEGTMETLEHTEPFRLKILILTTKIIVTVGLFPTLTVGSLPSEGCRLSQVDRKRVTWFFR